MYSSISFLRFYVKSILTNIVIVIQLATTYAISFYMTCELLLRVSTRKKAMFTIKPAPTDSLVKANPDIPMDVISVNSESNPWPHTIDHIASCTVSWFYNVFYLNIAVFVYTYLNRSFCIHRFTTLIFCMYLVMFCINFYSQLYNYIATRNGLFLKDSDLVF